MDPVSTEKEIESAVATVINVKYDLHTNEILGDKWKTRFIALNLFYNFLASYNHIEHGNPLITASWNFNLRAMLSI